MNLLGRIIPRRGASANLDTTVTKNQLVTGEILTTTDTKQMYLFDGTNLIPVVRARGTSPSSASDTGIAGEIAYDADYIYICVGTDEWKRVAIATW
jgi:hypothetical protein